jgi:diguanylate cyclase (GGDEF)-like protein
MKKLMREIQRRLEALDDRILILVLVVLITLLGYLDYLSGFEFSFSLFYLFPVTAAAWFVNRKSAVYLSVVSTIVWYISNLFAGQTYTQPVIGYWNAAVRLGFFLITASLLSQMKEALDREKELSRTDPNTGLLNSRAFYQLAEVELQRARRYERPYTLAYLDIDRFKQINDRFGHLVGDMVLKVIAGTLLANLRRTDLIARLGGDEFAILLPETDNEAARITVTKIQQVLLQAMKSHKWKVTFSIGAITYHKYSLRIDTMIKNVDELMYSVKDSGKNDIRFTLG